jgi:hypothetical protein
VPACLLQILGEKALIHDRRRRVPIAVCMEITSDEKRQPRPRRHHTAFPAASTGRVTDSPPDSGRGRGQHGSTGGGERNAEEGDVFETARMESSQINPDYGKMAFSVNRLLPLFLLTHCTVYPPSYRPLPGTFERISYRSLSILFAFRYRSIYPLLLSSASCRPTTRVSFTFFPHSPYFINSLRLLVTTKLATRRRLP